MNPLMPSISETLYCALPGKNKMHLAHINFPESIEVCITVLNIYHYSYLN